MKERHVNTLRDLKNSDEDSDINLKKSTEDLEIQVESPSGSWIQDISVWQNKELNFSQKKEITVEKKKSNYKKNKKFDWLEKKDNSFFVQVSNLFLRSKTLFRDSKYLNIQEKKQEKTPYLLLTKRYIKSIGIYGTVSVIIASMLLIFWFWYLDKIIVENRVNAWYEKLIDIRQWNLSLYEIQKNVNNARFDLLISDVFFSPFSIFPGDQIHSVDNVIAWGRYLSKSLDNMLALYSKTRDFIDEKSLSNIYITQLLENISPELRNIEASLLSSLYHYEAITWLPTQELEDKRLWNIEKIKTLLSYLQSLNTNFDTFLDMLGHNERKRYLIVFQNADEIRPTGWFMWSMGLLEIFRWKVQLFQKKDVYAIEWDLKSSDYERLPAPKGLNELTENFWLRDANYYVNLTDSSNAIKFFTDKAGISIDGIVYLNQNILLHLLEITGPVYFKQLDMMITSENFSEIMSLVVEAKAYKEGTLWTPKQILFDFMEVFWEKLQWDARYFDYMQSLVHDLHSRDIMVYSFNEDARNFLDEMWVSWAVNFDSRLDYQYPVYTSLSGNKSDRYMKRKFIQKVTSTDNCNFNVELTIENTHTLWKRKREELQSLVSQYDIETPGILEIQWIARNRQFVRMILPQKTQIIPQNDVAIVDYGSRKGIEYFTQTELTQTSYNTLWYILENPSCQAYSYTLYKQPWIPSYDMIIEVDGKRYSYSDLKEDFYFEVR